MAPTDHGDGEKGQRQVPAQGRSGRGLRERLARPEAPEAVDRQAEALIARRPRGQRDWQVELFGRLRKAVEPTAIRLFGHSAWRGKVGA